MRLKIPISLKLLPIQTDSQISIFISSMLSWTQLELQDALQKIRKGEKIRKVASESGIPKSTLHGRIMLEKNLSPSSDNTDSPMVQQVQLQKPGRKFVFTKSEELILANVIKIAQQRLLPLTTEIFCKHIQDILLKELGSGVQRRLPEGFKNCYPSQKWMRGFKKRHNLTIRRPESYSKTRGNVSPEFLKQWFTTTHDYVNEDIGLKSALNDPRRNFNIDETGAQISPKTGQVLALKGSRTVGQTSIGNEKEQLTVLAAICADSELIPPPLYLLPYVRIPDSVIDNIPDWVVTGKTPNGWINSDTLYEYLINEFDDWLRKNSVKRPVIVWADWHKSRLSYHTISGTLKKGIVLMGLPPNATHIMQPLDTHIFGPMKKAWKSKVADLTFQDDQLSKENFGAHFFPFYKTFLKDHKDEVSKSFQDTGLCPFDSTKPPYHKLKSVEKNTKPTEGVPISVGNSGPHIIVTKEINTQTDNSYRNRGTSTPFSNLPVCSFTSLETQNTQDDSLINLQSMKCLKDFYVAKAADNFGPTKQSCTWVVVPKRHDTYVSPSFRNHKFFPSPTSRDKKKRKTVTEILPNAISSKKLKDYTTEKRVARKEKDRKAAEKLAKAQANGKPKKKVAAKSKAHLKRKAENDIDTDNQDEAGDGSKKSKKRKVAAKSKANLKRTAEDDIDTDNQDEAGDGSKKSKKRKVAAKSKANLKRTAEDDIDTDNQDETGVGSKNPKKTKLHKTTKKSSTDIADSLVKTPQKRQKTQTAGKMKRIRLWNNLSQHLGVPLDEYNVGDFVLVKWRKSRYPGKVIEILQGEKLKVSCMEKIDKPGDEVEWRWPQRSDIMSYSMKNIVQRIESPKLVERADNCGGEIFFKVAELSDM